MDWPRDWPPAVVVHGWSQAMAAIAPGRPVTLLSARGAGVYGGTGWWAALVAAARAEHPSTPACDVLDCADAPGAAMAALRHGQRALLLDRACPAFAAVAAAAATLDAAVLPTRPPALDLAEPGAHRRLGGMAGREWVMASGCRLYLVTPAVLDLSTFPDTLVTALDAGDVAAVQLRLKDADDDAWRRAIDALRPLAQAREVAFLLNDRADLVSESGCDGAHVGQTDMPAREARRWVGGRTLGITCHDSRHLAMQAGEDGADYVAFGAFFPTVTKQAPTRAEPEILRWWSGLMELPCVAIGGITAANCAPLVQAGADFLAVVAAIWAHPDGAAAGVRAMNAAIAVAADETTAAARDR